MTYKKTLPISLAVVLGLMTACGDEEAASNEENAEAENGQDEEVGAEAEGDDNDENGAEDWPDETLTIVNPFSSGGSIDRQSRELTPLLEEELGEAVNVENREGGNGLVGAQDHLQNDPDDGSHILFHSHPHFDGGIFRGAEYEFDDYDYMGTVHDSPIGLFVPEDSDYETFEDLIDDLENNPGGLNYGMLTGSWEDVAGQMLLDELGLEAAGVPYDGGGPLRTALVSGEVDFAFTDIEGVYASIGDEARALGLFSNDPYPEDTDVPLMNDLMGEKGEDIDFPEMSSVRYLKVKEGFKDEHPERWDIWIDALEAAVTSDEYVEWGQEQGMNLEWQGPDETYDFLSESHEIFLEYGSAEEE
ncbi:tripartite tricarboxylate transporter substrate-binding protein [Salsuginibacillus kocurii]|uniref:tripartite tricarboxylate transporter substrate-binding protein n=1 Tax=Salsuginibacillus kocurii TaxID=427078 RepID=UPI00035E6729|nr:tripartite tricarboxylate transporter substrate-binding protein [Salsuginibacillus kocurii]